MVTKKATSKKVSTKSSAKEAAVVAAPPAITIGAVVMVHTKGSQHWTALVEPKIVDIEGLKFLDGRQVTGKEGHRLEGKRTLIPVDHVASIVEFAAEEDLWSGPQPKHPIVTDEVKVPLLTSHEQGLHEPHRGPRNDHGHGRGRNNRRRHKKSPQGNDARFQEQYDANRGRNFNR